MTSRLEIVVGRIETLALDAIVNAANRALMPGTGVDGAIRRAAGPKLTRHTEGMPPLEVGGAVITPGFAAPARFIIHTAAPIYSAPGDEADKIDGLTRCYTNVLTLAHEKGLRTVAFPCLGTGNFGWPRQLACEIATETCGYVLANLGEIERVVFCCFTEADAAPYRAVL